jgi:hypothetical protein
MKSLTVSCATYRGATSYRILERSHMSDGNQLERWRRGDDGVLKYLIEMYGISPEAAYVVALEAKTSGSAEITIP